MNNLTIPNPESLKQKKQNIKEQGIKKIHILADFDRTLTKAIVNGERVPSTISCLRNGDYISEDYAKKAHELANKYYPIEIDTQVPFEEKKQKMLEWWEAHFDLLIKSGLNKNHLKRIIKEGKIQFREGVLEFIDFLYEKNIPLIIISSSALGETIQMFLEKENRFYKNIHIITNFYKWDENENAIEIKKPIIHVANKEEIVIQKYPFFDIIKNRKNVILLGDNIEDVGMVKGFEYDNLIKIGFLNENIEEALEKYKKNFDAIITNEGNFEFVNKLIREIVK